LIPSTRPIEEGKFWQKTRQDIGGSLCIAESATSPPAAILRTLPDADGQLRKEGGTFMPDKASDAIVNSKTVLNCLLQLQRQGSEEWMRQLEATELELAEYLFESFSAIYQKLLELNGPFRKTRRVYRQM
jgi:hypothetical protein